MKFKLVESIDDRLVEYNSTVTNLPNKCGIYCYIFNVKDDDGNTYQKKYVGQATNILSRNKDHIKNSTKREYLIYNAMKAHPDYEIIVLETFDHISQKELDAAEIKWIKRLHTYLYDTESSDEVITVQYNNKTYKLECEGPGYNMTVGGSGNRKYTDTHIAELVELYKKNNFNHRKTVAEFKQLYEGSIFEKLRDDTFKTIALALGLPWKDERLGTKENSLHTASKYAGGITVYANKAVPTMIREVNKTTYNPDGSTKHIYYKDRHTWEIEINQDSPKYRREVKSANHAYALARLIYNRVMTDLGDKLKSIKNVKKLGGHAYWIHLLDELGIYDKYLDLLQYSDEDIEANLKADNRIPNSGIIMEYYGSFLYAIPSRFEKPNPV